MAENMSDNVTEGFLPGPPYWSKPVTIILAITMALFITCAVVGNIMVVVVIARHRGMRTRTNMFLCNLAITDLLCAIFDMPVALVTVIKGEWIFGPEFCQFNGFMVPLFFVASIHTLMYISVHKYISISRPFSNILTHRRILCMIAAAWFWALLASYMTIHGVNKVTYKPFTTQCGPEYPSDLRTYMHPIFTVLTCYLIPFVIITFCYVKVFHEIKAHAKRMEKNTNQERTQIFMQQRRITFTLFVVLIVFVLSWTPYVLYSIYASALKDKTKVNRNLNAVVYWFGYMNSAVNPIIYALRSPAFREGYKEIMCQGSSLIISEETDRIDSPRALRRLRIYLQRSLFGYGRKMSSTSATFPSGSRKTSMSSIINYVLQPNIRRKVSTTSLPESFKFHTNIGNAVVLGPKTSSRYDPKATGKCVANQVYYPETYKPIIERKSDTFGILVPEGEEQEPLLDKINNGCNIGGRKDSVSQRLQESDIVDPEKAFDTNVVTTEAGSIGSQGASPGFMNYEDDNVFVVVADIDTYLPKGSSSGAKMPFRCESQISTRSADSQVATPKSVSVPYQTPCDSPQIEEFMEGKGTRQSSSSSRFNFFQRLFSLSKQKSNPGETANSGNNNGSVTSSKFASSSFPADYSRSFSDDPRLHSTNRSLPGTASDNMKKAQSDTAVTPLRCHGSQNTRWSKHTKDKSGLGAGCFTEEELNVQEAKLNRIVSEDNRLVHYPSIETLDKPQLRYTQSTPHLRKKKHGRHSRQKRESAMNKKQKRTIMDDDGRNVRKSEGSTFISDHIGKSQKQTLKRSVSDPAFTYAMIACKVANRVPDKKSLIQSATNAVSSDENRFAHQTAGNLPEESMSSRRQTFSGVHHKSRGGPPSEENVPPQEQDKSRGLLGAVGVSPVWKKPHHCSAGAFPDCRDSEHDTNQEYSFFKKAHSELILAKMADPFKRWSFKGFYSKGEGENKESCV